MEEIHCMGVADQDDDGFTKVSKGSKKFGVQFQLSSETPMARIDAVLDDDEDTPLPLASDPLHNLKHQVYGSWTPGAPVRRSMGGDANRRLDPADSIDGKLIANVSPPASSQVPLSSRLSPEL
ncbi:hypothetical protein AX14_004804 [Amanita brunnescens Koide BX004]|nr:hypothetical protein AX14_004804 [Amanita brunnescens Koide BX004]